MRGITAALWAEGLKARRSKMLPATIFGFAFIAIMLGLLMYVARHPEIAGKSATLSTKASVFGSGDWPSFFNVLIQIILALGPLGFAMVAGWVFGREYSDRTVKDLLALPASRFSIVTAKFVIIFIWGSVIAWEIFCISTLTCLIVGIPGWSGEVAWQAFTAYNRSAFLSLLLSTPVALLASMSRGYLLPIAFAIFTLILTNFIAIGVPNIMPYFPWAIPALFSGISGQAALPQAGAISYFILVLTGALGFLGTAFWWRFADQT